VDKNWETVAWQDPLEYARLREVSAYGVLLVF
jgi:hypothetical protein